MLYRGRGPYLLAPNRALIDTVERQLMPRILSSQAAAVLAQRLRTVIAEQHMVMPDGQKQRLTASVGVACCPGFEVGDLGFPVWRAFDGILGMCICNDRRWPETFRVMGLQGVEMVVLGYNTPTDNIYHKEPVHRRMFHHLLSLQAGAYQNGTWVVAAAKAGKEDGYGLIGGSAIVAPTGEIVAQAITEEDELIVYDCDLDVGRVYDVNSVLCENRVAYFPGRQRLPAPLFIAK